MSTFTVQNVLVDQNAFQNEPDVCLDFFGLCLRVLKHNKKIFFSAPNIDGILNMWALGVGIEHPEAIRTHKHFFLQLLEKIKDDLKQAGSIDTPEQIEETSRIISERFPTVHPNEAIVWSFLLQ